MERVAASLIVATVHDLHLIWDGAVVTNPGIAMGVYRPVVLRVSAIAAPVRPSPPPAEARILLIDLTPKLGLAVLMPAGHEHLHKCVVP